jgi:hypothetical protein
LKILILFYFKSNKQSKPKNSDQLIIIDDDDIDDDDVSPSPALNQNKMKSSCSHSQSAYNISNLTASNNNNNNSLADPMLNNSSISHSASSSRMNTQLQKSPLLSSSPSKHNIILTTSLTRASSNSNSNNLISDAISVDSQTQKPTLRQRAKNRLTVNKLIPRRDTQNEEFAVLHQHNHAFANRQTVDAILNIKENENNNNKKNQSTNQNSDKTSKNSNETIFYKWSYIKSKMITLYQNNISFIIITILLILFLIYLASKHQWTWTMFLMFMSFCGGFSLSILVAGLGVYIIFKLEMSKYFIKYLASLINDDTLTVKIIEKTDTNTEKKIENSVSTATDLSISNDPITDEYIQHNKQVINQIRNFLISTPILKENKNFDGVYKVSHP